jgi:hypothetical protein
MWRAARVHAASRRSGTGVVLVTRASEAEHTGASMRPVPWHVKGVHPDAGTSPPGPPGAPGLGRHLAEFCSSSGRGRGHPSRQTMRAARRGPVRNRVRRPQQTIMCQAIGARSMVKWRIDGSSRDDSPPAARLPPKKRQPRLAEAASASATKPLGGTAALPRPRERNRFRGGRPGADGCKHASGGGAAVAIWGR